jgi:hypothetical protein
VNDIVRARLFGSRSTVYGLIKSGALDSYRSGNCRSVTAESVRRYRAQLIEANRNNSGLAPAHPNLQNQKPRKSAPVNEAASSTTT